VKLAVALISAVVALAGAILSLYGQRRIAFLQHTLTSQREAQTREAKAEALLAKYRDPLLRSAHSLQSRCYSIVQLGFLRIYYHKSDRDRQYATSHTLYVIAEYLGWVEVVRREVQFLDLGNIESTRRLQELLRAIKSAILTDGLPLDFRLFSGEQQAIGELMLIERDRGEGTFFDCIGFAAFIKQINTGEFSHWFEKVAESIEAAACDSKSNHSRLIRLQHCLIDLIDFLDPDRTRIPDSRDKISNIRRL
jgi:hypothetical protein